MLFHAYPNAQLTSPEDPQERRNPSLAIFHSPFVKGLSAAYLGVSSSVLHDLDYILGKKCPPPDLGVR